MIVVGGASEALNHDKEAIEIILKSRKGFIKLALRFGRPLVPVFNFGEHFLYNQAPNPKGSLLRKFQNWFKDTISFSPPIFYGRGIFQYNFGLVPYRKPLNIVVGKPIPVPKIENPTNEEVEAMHAKYVEALVQLYDDYNPEYGDKNVKLVIG